MREETQFSVLHAAGKPEYDKACKNYFRNREAIAPVLKAVVSEYQGYSTEEIIRFIDADSIEEDIPVSDLPAKITDAGTEMASVYEKTIFFDVHFKAVNPVLSHGEMRVELHIDFEVQNKYKPSNPAYPLIKRGIYYGAREISSQLGVLTGTTDYADLSKVISIWVCNKGIPPKLRNTVSRYYLTKEDIVGNTEEPIEDYDLLEIIVIRRGDNAPEQNDLFQYLEGVFTSDLEKMKKYVDMPKGSKVEKEARKMDGLGESLYMDGVEKGLSQGISQGLSQGLKALVGTLKNLLNTPEEVLERVRENEGYENVTLEDIKKYY